MLSVKKMLSDLANGIKDLAQKLGLIDDYVVEQGTSGIWTYRKWNSGIAECWGMYTAKITSWSSWGDGNAYEGTLQTVTYPFTFSEIPRVIHVSTGAGGGGGLMAVEIRANSAAFTTNSFQFYPIRPNNGGNTTSYVGVSVQGRWK